MHAVKATFNADTLISRVEALIDSNRLGAARPLLAAARRIAPPSPGLSQLSARLSMRNGALEEAQRELDGAILATPNHGGLRKCRADVRQRLRDLDGAARDAAEAVILDRLDPGAKALLGAIMIELGRPTDAEACLAEAVAGCPDNPLFREGLAAAREMTGQVDAALETLEEGFVACPNAALLRNAAVLLCIKQRDFERAARLAEDARRAGLADATLFGLHGHALSCLERHTEAKEAYAAALRLEPNDPHVRHLAVAGRQAPASGDAALQYVRTLFDEHADRFDTHIMSLGYRAPEAIAALAFQHPGLRSGARLETVLDLGCGTGLMAVAIKDLPFKTLIGVDLSAAMLRQAEKKNRYTELRQADLISFLTERDMICDLMLAADVMCYLGDLEPVLTLAYGRLKEGGWLVFSVEALLSEQRDVNAGWQRLLHGRHAHSDQYIADVALRIGFRVQSMTKRTIRYEGSIAVPGYIFALARDIHTR